MIFLDACVQSKTTHLHGVTSSYAGLCTRSIPSVSEFLPPVDLIRFALCNRQILDLSQADREIRPLSTKDEKWSLLRRLERDLPQSFACEICNILHQYEGSDGFEIQGFTPRTRDLPCVQSHKNWKDGLRTHSRDDHQTSNLSFLHIRLAMKRFHHGLGSGISLESLSFTQGCYHQTRPGMISLFSIEGQVCPEPLAFQIRMQDIVLVDKQADFLSQTNPYVSSGHSLDNYEICVHQTLFAFLRNIHPNKATMSETATHEVAPSTVLRSLQDGNQTCFTFTCRYCLMNAELEFCPFSSKAALIMTRWVDLGPVLKRDDLSWKKHIRRPPHPFDNIPGPVKVHLPGRQETRETFEALVQQSYRRLRCHNLAYLRSQRYEPVMPYDKEAGIWYILFNRPSRTKVKNYFRSHFGLQVTYRDSWTCVVPAPSKKPTSATWQRVKQSLEEFMEFMIDVDPWYSTSDTIALDTYMHYHSLGVW